jgi:predicted ATPase with chaperone activity
VARTIADLEGASGVLATHVAEAVALRMPARRTPGRDDLPDVRPSP